MSQVTKLLLKIVMDRMKGKIKAELDDAQSGFRQGKWTREGLLNLKTLPHVTISSTISLTMPSSTMEFNQIVDDEPATRNDIVYDADVK